MLCCVCVANARDAIGVFDDKNEELNVAAIIEKHLWFKPEPRDDNKPKICSPCWKVVNEFHEFYCKTEEAYNRFHALRSDALKIKTESEQVVVLSIKQEFDEISEEKRTQVELEIESNIPSLDGELPTSIERNPLDNDPQIDEDSVLSEYECDKEPPETCFSNSTSSSADSSSENEKVVLKKKPIKKVRHQITGRVKKSDAGRDSKDDATRKKRKRLDPKLTEEMIHKHIPMICNLCNFDCKTFVDVGSHFKQQHPKVKPYIVCCNKRFTRRHYIAQHALQHEDPNCFRCDQCNKSFKTTYNLHTHNLSFHNEEDKGIHACEFCPQKFARRKLLEFHKPTHIPKETWSFFCMKCPTPRPFASEYLLKTHESVHKRETNICHVCAKEIKDKYLFEKHVRLHFEDSGPRVKCPFPDCESWLKDEYNLKDHLRRHNSEGIIYKCPQCEKVCKNRKALSQHKRNNHSDKVYTCSQCEKSFKKKITLKEHMAHHTGESLYKCPFCPRTFNSNANMYSHKKKQHPVD